MSTDVKGKDRDSKVLYFSGIQRASGAILFDYPQVLKG